MAFFGASGTDIDEPLFKEYYSKAKRRMADEDGDARGRAQFRQPGGAQAPMSAALGAGVKLDTRTNFNAPRLGESASRSRGGGRASASRSRGYARRAPLRARVPRKAPPGDVVAHAAAASASGRAAVRAQVDAIGGFGRGGGGAAAAAARRGAAASRSTQVFGGGGGGRVAAAGAAALATYMPLREVNRINFLVNHGIHIGSDEDVDLDHTSCEESSCEAPHASHARGRRPPAARSETTLEFANRMFPGSSEEGAAAAGSAKSGRGSGGSAAALSVSAQVNEEAAAAAAASGSSASVSLASLPPNYDEASVAYFAGQPVDDEDEDADIDDKLEDDYDDEADASDSDSLVRGGKSAVSASAPRGAPGRRATDPPDYGGPGDASTRCTPAVGGGGHGSVSRMNDCFLCRWGQHDYDSVNNEHMAHMLRLIFDNIGEVDTPFIALAVHAFYKNVIRPAAAGAGQWLPKWRSKQIFICIETHNFHPEIKLARDIRNISIVQSALERKLFSRTLADDAAALLNAGAEGEPVERAPADSDTANLKLIKQYETVLKLKWTLYGIKMPAMNFHRPAKDIQLGADRQFFKSVKLRRADKRRKISAIGDYEN